MSVQREKPIWEIHMKKFTTKKRASKEEEEEKKTDTNRKRGVDRERKRKSVCNQNEQQCENKHFAPFFWLSSFWVSRILASLSRSYCTNKHTNGCVFTNVVKMNSFVTLSNWAWACMYVVRLGSMMNEIANDNFSVQYNNYKIKQNFARPLGKSTHTRTYIRHIYIPAQNSRWKWKSAKEIEICSKTENWRTHTHIHAGQIVQHANDRKNLLENVSIRAVIKQFQCSAQCTCIYGRAKFILCLAFCSAIRNIFIIFYFILIL